MPVAVLPVVSTSTGVFEFVRGIVKARIKLAKIAY